MVNGVQNGVVLQRLDGTLLQRVVKCSVSFKYRAA